MPNGTCSKPGCDEPALAKGFCKKHYTEARNAQMRKAECILGDCDRPRYQKDGYCVPHYQRLMQYGDPLAGPPMRRRRSTAAVSNGTQPNAPEYYVNHRRIRAERGPAWQQVCAHCCQQACDWAQIHGTSGENPDEYMPLCRSCHHAYDGRSANLPHHEGETHPQAKLTEVTVREIRARHAAGEPGPDLATEYAAAFAVTTRTISNVISFRTWTNVA